MRGEEEEEEAPSSLAPSQHHPLPLRSRSAAIRGLTAGNEPGVAAGGALKPWGDARGVPPVSRSPRSRGPWKNPQQRSAQPRLSSPAVPVSSEALANSSLFPSAKEKNLGFQISSASRGRSQRGCSRPAEGSETCPGLTERGPPAGMCPGAGSAQPCAGHGAPGSRCHRS